MSDRIYLAVDTRPNLTIAEAAALISGDDAIGMVYSPSAARFLTRRNDKWCGPDRKPTDLSSVFEAVFFNQDVQVRWVQREHGTGEATITTESSAPADGRPFRDAAEPDSGRLLWGTSIRSVSTDGWATCGSAQVGTLTVPVRVVRDAARDAVVRLHQYTYVTEDPHGNQAFADVRYTRLTVGGPE